MEPTPERIAELEAIYTEVLADGRVDLADYYSWNDLVEGEEALSFDEWQWMHKHYYAEIDIRLVRKTD